MSVNLDRHPSARIAERTDDRLRSMERTLWTYVPVSNPTAASCAAFPSAPDTPASTSASKSPSPDTGLWLSLSGKVTQRPLSWRGWQTRPWIRRLSGTISDLSTVDRSAGAFISSLPVIPANPSATPAGGAAKPIRVTYGRTSPVSSTRSDPSGSGVRMSRGTSLWDFPTSSTAYGAWATRQRRACSQREKLALGTDGAASSSWPTPTASDGGYVPDLMIEAGQVRLVSPADIATKSGGQFAVSESTRAWMALWRTLKAVGWTATASSFRFSPPVRVSFKHGNGSSLRDLTPNPQFYEHLMGWPTGWTAPGAPATEYAAWLQRARGQFSSLLTSWTPGEADPS